MSPTGGLGTVALPQELVELVEGGASVQVGTRDAQLRPECVRGVGCVVSPDRQRISVLLNESTAGRTLANLAAHSPIAVTFSRPIDHRTVQVKGRCHGVRPGGGRERLVAERYLASLVEALYLVGMSRAVTRRLQVAPCVVVELEIAELYHQTPGPEAGQRLVSA